LIEFETSELEFVFVVVGWSSELESVVIYLTSEVELTVGDWTS
jgi:hypothetical protein